MTDNPPSPDGPDEYPTEDELPDEPMTVEEIDPFTVDDGDFDTVDNFARAEWKSQTTGDERIRTVVNRSPIPKSADDIADAAPVPETKARATLSKLAEEGIVRSQQTDSGTLYESD